MTDDETLWNWIKGGIDDGYDDDNDDNDELNGMASLQF